MEKYESMEVFAKTVQHNSKIMQAAYLLDIPGKTVEQVRGKVAETLKKDGYKGLDDFLQKADFDIIMPSINEK